MPCQSGHPVVHSPSADRATSHVKNLGISTAPDCWARSATSLAHKPERRTRGRPPPTSHHLALISGKPSQERPGPILLGTSPFVLAAAGHYRELGSRAPKTARLLCASRGWVQLPVLARSSISGACPHSISVAPPHLHHGLRRPRRLPRWVSLCHSHGRRLQYHRHVRPQDGPTLLTSTCMS